MALLYLTAIPKAFSAIFPAGQTKSISEAIYEEFKHLIDAQPISHPGAGDQWNPLLWKKYKGEDKRESICDTLPNCNQ